MTTKTKVLSRRAFLLSSGGAGLAVAAALAIPKGKSSEEKSSKRATRGYHAGEHIHNYYRTTKV